MLEDVPLHAVALHPQSQQFRPWVTDEWPQGTYQTTASQHLICACKAHHSGYVKLRRGGM